MMSEAACQSSELIGGNCDAVQKQLAGAMSFSEEVRSCADAAYSWLRGARRSNLVEWLSVDASLSWRCRWLRGARLFPCGIGGFCGARPNHKGAGGCVVAGRVNAVVMAWRRSSLSWSAESGAGLVTSLSWSAESGAGLVSFKAG